MHDLTSRVNKGVTDAQGRHFQQQPVFLRANRFQAGAKIGLALQNQKKDCSSNTKRVEISNTVHDT
jgi:hypothetical protein